MAITLADFNKIWASTSPLTPYTFTDPNYAEGWNFIGSTPPARQMWDYLQNYNDEKMKFIVDNFVQNDSNDFKDGVTFAETYVRASFLAMGKIITISYQGENKAHSADDTIFTVPAEYIPKGIENSQYFVVGLCGSTCTQMYFNGSGEFKIGSALTGRVYLNVTYFI